MGGLCFYLGLTNGNIAYSAYIKIVHINFKSRQSYTGSPAFDYTQIFFASSASKFSHLYQLLVH
jgi:hypothetical protein